MSEAKQKCGRKPNISPDSPNFKKLKKESEKLRNKKYYNDRGAYIHKMIYFKKRYQIPAEILNQDLDTRVLSFAELKDLFNKTRLYVDLLKDKERKSKSTDTIKKMNKSKEPEATEL